MGADRMSRARWRQTGQGHEGAGFAAKKMALSPGSQRSPEQDALGGERQDLQRGQPQALSRHCERSEAIQRPQSASSQLGRWRVPSRSPAMTGRAIAALAMTTTAAAIADRGFFFQPLSLNVRRRLPHPSQRLEQPWRDAPLPR